MKIRYMSDLHTEMWCDPTDLVPSIGEDLVVLAGDIGLGTAGIEWAKRAFEDRPVIYVFGNHEFYRHAWVQTLDEAREVAHGSNVHLLERDSVQIGDLEVLGCTLWTDFRVAESVGVTQQMAMSVCARRFNDYRVIFNDQDNRPLWPEDTLERHEISVEWLRTRLHRTRKKVLVVTHHAPFIDHENPRFTLDEMGAGFYVDLTDMMDAGKIHAWIFGHTHHGGVFPSGKSGDPVDVVSNPRGYPHERSDFDWNRCLEIDQKPVETLLPEEPR